MSLLTFNEEIEKLCSALPVFLMDTVTALPAVALRVVGLNLKSSVVRLRVVAPPALVAAFVVSDESDFSLLPPPPQPASTIPAVATIRTAVIHLRARMSLLTRTVASADEASPNMEASLPHRVLFQHLDALDVSPAGTLAHPSHHAIDGVGLALEHGLDGAVIAVADRTGDADGAGHTFAAIAEEHALHATVHHDPPSHRHGRRPYARRLMEVLSGRVILRPVDLERSLRFYGDTLGLKIYREYGSGAGRGVVFFTGGGYLEITGRAPAVDVD